MFTDWLHFTKCLAYLVWLDSTGPSLSHVSESKSLEGGGFNPIWDLDDSMKLMNHPEIQQNNPC